MNYDVMFNKSATVSLDVMIQREVIKYSMGAVDCTKKWIHGCTLDSEKVSPQMFLIVIQWILKTICYQDWYKLTASLELVYTCQPKVTQTKRIVLLDIYWCFCAAFTVQIRPYILHNNFNYSKTFIFRNTSAFFTLIPHTSTAPILLSSLR